MPLSLELNHYAELIEAMLLRPVRLEFTSESESTIQVERGLIYPAAMLGEIAAAEQAFVDRDFTLHRRRVIDRAGQSRPAYLGLLTYSMSQAYRLADGVLDYSKPLILAGADSLASPFRQIKLGGSTIPAAYGEATCDAIWRALALAVAGEIFGIGDWIRIAAEAFARVIHAQRCEGGFLHSTGGHSVETVGYDELVLLHAVASYSVHTNNAAARTAMFRAAEFQMAEMQPDHATNQPWGLFAFITNPATRSVADQMLHSASISSGGKVDGVAAILLADALYCLRRSGT